MKKKFEYVKEFKNKIENTKVLFFGLNRFGSAKNKQKKFMHFSPMPLPSRHM
jgi:hypothetical protein